MTEHEVPTVARATLWLDTSSETSTRPAECLDDCATLAFERPAEPTSAGAAPEQPAETAVLDRAQLIAAIDRHVTDVFELDPPIAREVRARLPAWRSVATHALAMVVGAAVSAAVLATPRPQPVVAHTKPRVEQRAPERRPAAPSPTKAPMEPEAPAPSTVPVQASLRDAVDALARGDYPAARDEYEALARQHRNDAALSAIAAILAARTRGQCTDPAQKDGSCAR